MHRLLKRQLKKIALDEKMLSDDKLKEFIHCVNQAYINADDDRLLLENILHISSEEMQDLYHQLKLNSQTELEKSEERYKRLVENLQTHYFFYSHNIEGVFTYISDSITRILGYQPDEFLTHYSEYLTDDPVNDHVEEKFRLTLKGKIQAPYKLSFFHKDGSKRIIEVTETPILDVSSGEIIGVDGIARDISNEYKIQKKIAFLAKKDPLTGLSNRIYFDRQVESLIIRSKRSGKKFAFLFLDLDNFKLVNDTFGHNMGDELLKSVVKKISPNIRKQDIFARIGGDEFVIVLSDIDDIFLATSIKKIMGLMHQDWVIKGHILNISTSMGIVVYPRDGKTLIELMKKSDIALYKAKDLGRDNFCFYTQELNQIVHEEMQLMRDMEQALKNNEFKLFFQAKLALAKDKIIGAEALIRWQHPQLGLILPDKFIALSENSGLIQKIGQWVIEEGCRAIKRFELICPVKFHLSLNISTRQLQHGDLHAVIHKALMQTGIDPGRLIIEITESIMIEDSEKMIEKLDKIRSLGVTICMDDFGTGYSSLAYLHRLPIDSIKIDKSFIDHIVPENNQAMLVDTIIAMANTLNKPVIAEGVETEYQRNYLIEKACRYYQGYLFSEAVSEESFVQILSQNT